MLTWTNGKTLMTHSVRLRLAIYANDDLNRPGLQFRSMPQHGCWFETHCGRGLVQDIPEYQLAEEVACRLCRSAIWSRAADFREVVEWVRVRRADVEDDPFEPLLQELDGWRNGSTAQQHGPLCAAADWLSERGDDFAGSVLRVAAGLWTLEDVQRLHTASERAFRSPSGHHVHLT